MIPRILPPEEKEKAVKADTSVDSPEMLCPLHIERLINVIERLGDKASMKTLLAGKPEQITVYN